MTRESAVRVVLLYPDLLGTYGDSGNAVILAKRLEWRGYRVELETVLSADTAPSSGDLYLMGGGEDLPQALAARKLGRNGPLHRAVEDGAAVLAVCAGLQILGESFIDPLGEKTTGLGLIDCHTVRGTGKRAVGELVVEAHPESGLGHLSGYENHGGLTHLGPGVRASGHVVSGVGNASGPDGAPGTDGFWTGRIWGTYLHGPCLARNADLADLLISWVVGEVKPLDDHEPDALRRERLAVAAAEASNREVGTIEQLRDNLSSFDVAALRQQVRAGWQAKGNRRT